MATLKNTCRNDTISGRHFIILILLERYNTHKNGRVPLNIFIVEDESQPFFLIHSFYVISTQRKIQDKICSKDIPER